MLLIALPHDSPSPHLDREAHCSLFLRTKVTEVTQGKLLCAKSPSLEVSDSKGTLKALSQPPKCLPLTVGLKLLSTAGALQQLLCQDCKHPAGSRGFDSSECKTPAQAIAPGHLSLDTAGLSMISASISGWKWRGEGSQTRVSNLTSTSMRFDDHGSFWVL